MTPATFEDRRRKDTSIATLNSGARDNNSRLLYARYHGFMQHYENLNPLDGQLDWRTVSRTYQMDPALAEADRMGATLDALHLDSVSGMRRWGRRMTITSLTGRTQATGSPSPTTPGASWTGSHSVSRRRCSSIQLRARPRHVPQCELQRQ